MTLEHLPGQAVPDMSLHCFQRACIGFLAPAEAKENWILQYSPAMDAFHERYLPRSLHLLYSSGHLRRIV